MEKPKMNPQNELAQDTADRELATSRIMNAPPEKVFEAVRNPTLLARWFGPAGFTNTFHTFDFRPGGNWEFIMHGPDGTDYLNKCVFAEIVAPERLVFDHVVAPIFRATLTFEPTEQAGTTRVGFRQRFESAEVCEGLKAICIPANEQNLDRLEAVLTEF
jgi:uncharacterized protein YndB with AHSA1/START domain